MQENTANDVGKYFAKVETAKTCFKNGGKRILKQALKWQIEGFLRGSGRRRENRQGTVSRALNKVDLSWEEAAAAGKDGVLLYQHVTQCIMDAS